MIRARISRLRWNAKRYDVFTHFSYFKILIVLGFYCMQLGPNFEAADGGVKNDRADLAESSRHLISVELVGFLSPQKAKKRTFRWLSTDIDTLPHHHHQPHHPPSLDHFFISNTTPFSLPFHRSAFCHVSSNTRFFVSQTSFARILPVSFKYSRRILLFHPTHHAKSTRSRLPAAPISSHSPELNFELAPLTDPSFRTRQFSIFIAAPQLCIAILGAPTIAISAKIDNKPAHMVQCGTLCCLFS